MLAIVIYLALFSALISLDQCTKLMAVTEKTFTINKGILFNLFEHTPEHIKIIFLSTYSSFLLLTFIVTVSLLSKKEVFLKVALATLVSGICSNSLDKIWKGYTIDFISFSSYAFNIADIYILGATGCIAFYIIFNKENPFSKENARRFNLIEPRMQINYAMRLSLSVIATSLVLGTLSYTFLKTYLSPVIMDSHKVTGTFIYLFLSTSLLLFFAFFIFGLYLSGRTIGPLYGLNKYVEDLLEDNTRAFKIREKDHIRYIEKIAKNIKKLAIKRKD